MQFFEFHSMIFLTGDVHQTDPRMGDQRYLPSGWTEVRTCERYLELANKHSVFPTLLFTGLAVEREGDLIHSLIERFQFEIGGHTYSANRPRLVLGPSHRLLGLANGPYWWQKADMSKTLRCIQGKLGATVRSWRNHAYRMDRNTYTIAAELGIRYVSNIVAGSEAAFREVNGIIEVPINTLPDHEALGHDQHRCICQGAQDWVDQVLRQIDFQQAHGLPSVILAHPLCMFVEDRLAAFERLCAAIQGNTASLREYKAPLSTNRESGISADTKL